MSVKLVKHSGGCHCGKVRFEVLAPEVLEVMDCNCSICVKKQNQHIILVPEKNFKLIQGEDFLTVYTFGTGVAKHTFCKVCGVQSFYSPRAAPEGKGVLLHCIDSETVKEFSVVKFDAHNWDDSMKKFDLYLKKAMMNV